MTASVEIVRLLANTRVQVPGALDDMLKLELFNTLDEFFVETHSWLQEISVTTAVDDKTYTLTPTASTGAIISLMSVVNSSEFSVSATMPTTGNLLLTNAPSQIEVLTVKVALTVVEPLDADGYPNIPSWLLKKYGGAIFEGLVGRMMTQPVKPYTNERMAIYHMRKFRALISQARSEARRENSYDAQRWRFPQFARGSQR